MNIKDMVKDGKRATFTNYRHKQLWYQTECGFDFPVPIEDTGDGVFMADEKAMILMRYIRKHIESIEAGIAECINDED